MVTPKFLTVNDFVRILGFYGPAQSLSSQNSDVSSFTLESPALVPSTTIPPSHAHHASAGEFLISSVCYNFKQLRQSSTVVVSKVRSQMSLEECKSWTCIVLQGLRVKVQVERLSIKD